MDNTTTTPQQPTATITPEALADLERLALAAHILAAHIEESKKPYKVVMGNNRMWHVINIDGVMICETFMEVEARFIAAACNAVPALVAQLRAERAAREAAERELEAGIKHPIFSRRTLIMERDEARRIAQGWRERCAESETSEKSLFDELYKLCDERDEARQRAERAEAYAAELRALLAKRVEVYGYQWYVWDLDEACALLARTGAERKDGGE